MANASRPRKSSPPKISRGLSPKGTVPVSAKASAATFSEKTKPHHASRWNQSKPQSNQLKRGQSPLGTVPSLELFVTLVAGAENLSVNAARGLLHLRQAVLAAQQGAKGALIKLELYDDGTIDWAESALRSPVFRDVFCLLCLQIIDDFSTHREAVRRVLVRIKRGFMPGAHMIALREKLCRWTNRSNKPIPDPFEEARRKNGIDDLLVLKLSFVVWQAVEELIAASMRRHQVAPPRRTIRCPICRLGKPFARLGSNFICSSCETRWPAAKKMYCGCYPIRKSLSRDEAKSITGFEVLTCGHGHTSYVLDDALKDAFNPSHYLDVVRLLDQPWQHSTRSR
ncbi:hypothetical protein PLCT2_00203 [Planctomycetaceae bacterium]|nr:hypothetical protein PLCT2_00203 [Planctomycetaceae bacterium]